MEIQTLRAPCCDHEVEFETILQRAEWASNVGQWEFWEWNYYRCPHCKTPCWFGYSNEGGVFGIFGAAPVADLIPISSEKGMPLPEIGVGSVTLQYRGVTYEIHGDKRYWKNA